jgi:sortase A
VRLPKSIRAFADDPLLGLGVRLMAFALLVGGAVAAYALTSGSTDRAAVKSAAESRAEPLARSDPGVDPWKEPTVTPIEAAEPETEPEPNPEPKEPYVRPEPLPEPVPEPRPEPAPEPRPGPAPEPQPEPDPLPVRQADWPAPTQEQVEDANRPRRYELPPGAIMGLTVGSIGLHDAPVLSSDAPDALVRGVAHASGTSMPWSETPERNVYLAGHRLGWPGTGSHLIFYRLDELGEGDEVVLRDREGRRYGYRVIDTFSVGPEDSWVTGRVRGRDLLTLQTCVGPNFSERLIVRAERV